MVNRGGGKGKKDAPSAVWEEMPFIVKSVVPWGKRKRNFFVSKKNSSYCLALHIGENPPTVEREKKGEKSDFLWRGDPSLQNKSSPLKALKEGKEKGKNEERGGLDAGEEKPAKHKFVNFDFKKAREFGKKKRLRAVSSSILQEEGGEKGGKKERSW